MTNVTFSETSLSLSEIGYLSQNFGSRYASKSIKGSEDADQSIFQKKIEPKMAHWLGA